MSCFTITTSYCLFGPNISAYADDCRRSLAHIKVTFPSATPVVVTDDKTKLNDFHAEIIEADDWYHQYPPSAWRFLTQHTTGANYNLSCESGHNVQGANVLKTIEQWPEYSWITRGKNWADGQVNLFYGDIYKQLLPTPFRFYFADELLLTRDILIPLMKHRFPRAGVLVQDNVARAASPGCADIPTIPKSLFQDNGTASVGQFATLGRTLDRRFHIESTFSGKSQSRASFRRNGAWFVAALSGQVLSYISDVATLLHRNPTTIELGWMNNYQMEVFTQQSPGVYRSEPWNNIIVLDENFLNTEMRESRDETFFANSPNCNT